MLYKGKIRKLEELSTKYEKRLVLTCIMGCSCSKAANSVDSRRGEDIEIERTRTRNSIANSSFVSSGKNNAYEVWNRIDC